jgi:hypothetical protein
LDITGGNYSLVSLYLSLFSLLASLCVRQVLPPAKD